MKNKLILAINFFICLIGRLMADDDLNIVSFGDSTLSFNAQRALDSLNSAIVDLNKMVAAFAFIAGLLLLFKGLASLKAFGQHVTHSARPGELLAPMMSIITGTFLIYLPSTLEVSLATIFGDSQIQNSEEILSNLPSAAKQKWGTLIEVIVKYLQFIGLLSFVRGWFLIAKVGSQGGQPGQFGKGITHLVGGVLLYNFNETAVILAELFGFTLT